MKLQKSGTYQLLPLFIALVFVVTGYATKAHAQIVGSLVADIPFQFHVGNTRLPAGKYIVRAVDDSNLEVMEISSADGSIATMFEVRDAEANSKPIKSELIFNKYGNRYFLETLFDESNPSGSAVLKSGYEKRIAAAAAESQAQVPAHHSDQQGN